MWLSIAWDQYRAIMYKFREPCSIHVHLITPFPSSSLDTYLLNLLIIYLLTNSIHMPKWTTAYYPCSFTFLYIQFTICIIEIFPKRKQKWIRLILTCNQTALDNTKYTMFYSTYFQVIDIWVILVFPGKPLDLIDLFYSLHCMITAFLHKKISKSPFF